MGMEGPHRGTGLFHGERVEGNQPRHCLGPHGFLTAPRGPACTSGCAQGFLCHLEVLQGCGCCSRIAPGSVGVTAVRVGPSEWWHRDMLSFSPFPVRVRVVGRDPNIPCRDGCCLPSPCHGNTPGSICHVWVLDPTWGTLCHIPTNARVPPGCPSRARGAALQPSRGSPVPIPSLRPRGVRCGQEGCEAPPGLVPREAEPKTALGSRSPDPHHAEPQVTPAAQHQPSA